MEVTAQSVLNYVVARATASEATPLKLGNVEFWHQIPGYPVGLCYSLPVSQWDTVAVQADLNKITEPYWDEMCTALHANI